MKILINDRIAENCSKILQKAGFEVVETSVAQNQLENFINDNNIDAIIVRTATEIHQELIEACPSLKLIAKAGVGMDNIDVEFAIDSGLHVVNTPNASTKSVAEMVFAHLFGMARFLHQSNREMPLEGDTRFKDLKKAFGDGIELHGKTLGIIGFGTIGQEVAKIAIGLGMNVLASDPNEREATITLEFFNKQQVTFTIETVSFNEVLQQSDFITLHMPDQDDYVIAADEIKKMKNGVGIINLARGGVINEVDLIHAIENKKVQFAALDVFEDEPTPAVQVLMNPELSLSPHIGASTIEAQNRIGEELANQIIKLLN